MAIRLARSDPKVIFPGRLTETNLRAANDTNAWWGAVQVLGPQWKVPIKKPAVTPVDESKKTQAEEWGMAIGLERTLDILQGVKERREKSGFPKVVLGFAAETQDAFKYGRSKLIRKGLDFIAINDVTAPGAGFGVSTNRVTLLDADGLVAKFPLQSKAEVAEQIVVRVAEELV